MTSALKGIVRRVVEVVAPAPPPPAPPARPSPRSEPPVLDHPAGLDRVYYGSADSPAVRSGAEYTVNVNSKPYKLFFLCGHPRSGTHWLDHIISRHPKVFITGEYRFEALRTAFDDLTTRPWHAAFREPMRTEAERCFRDTVRRVLGASSELRPWADWLGDRTPRSIQPFLPGAPNFLILRDPRDIITSWAHQEFKSAGYHYSEGHFGPQLDVHRAMFLKDPLYFKSNPGALLGLEPFVKRLAEAWRNHTRADLSVLRSLASGEAEGRAMVIRYENLHSDPEGQRTAMYRYLDLDPAEADSLSEETRSKPGVTEENPHSIYRKGEVGDWKAYFHDDAKRWFKEQAGDTLIELGYAKDHDW